MSDYQPTEQDKVLLDYAQTAQRRADPWVEFECRVTGGRSGWGKMERAHFYLDYMMYRRKPRTCKLIGPDGREWELPAPDYATEYAHDIWGAVANFRDRDFSDQWLAALREIAAGGENE